MNDEQNYKFENGIVTPQGIRFKESYYTSSKCIENKWFEIAERIGEWSIPIIVQSSNLDEIILFDIAITNQEHLIYSPGRHLYYQKMQELKTLYYQRRSRRFN